MNVLIDVVVCLCIESIFVHSSLINSSIKLEIKYIMYGYYYRQECV